MADYRFESVWVLGAAQATVLDVLTDFVRYPQWWPAVRAVTHLTAGDAAGIGMTVEYLIYSPLGYSLNFRTTLERHQPPNLFRARCEGDLEGSGLVTLSYADGATTARYSWQVATTKRWMNLLAPVARPLFSWAHARVMLRGARGLAGYLGVPLLRATSR
jgi:hypothetical protein